MIQRVVVTGMGGVTSLGDDWHTISTRMLAGENGVRQMPDWAVFNGLNTQLAAPVDHFQLPAHYTRKKVRSMGRVSQLSTRASELALIQAGLLDDPVLTSGQTGIAFGSSVGSTPAIRDMATMFEQHTTRNIGGTTYLQMMPHTTAANTGLFFGLRGRLIPTSSTCTSGSQAIGYACEAIRYGKQQVMVAGGAEELCPSQAAVFDTLRATTQMNDQPHLTPRPFDLKRDGLVIGEGAAALILESLEHAQARGAVILAEVVGFGTNCDARHITQPTEASMQACMEMSLQDAGLPASAMDYISAHGTATSIGDFAESRATAALFGANIPISSLKSYFGHTLGACGAIEAWLTLEMLHSGWFAPTLNLTEPDPACSELDHIIQTPRRLQAEYFQSNNFAFGGVNTSLVFRRWS
ncbi:MAG: beta-ketoacyl-ACP synthase [Marinospirillum sp.]|uniref:beta-ketoacyl-ACP synthase n=1 Tax=Marinospirillum sp. TaxID=2183934 RepID=UPI001A0911AB|nr:beta-ketoacyl-ACP synthase [Marinospirillum sp.]MBE0506860.1 beta-ketoacyl-ACP synthase [Marinospirillum sp.]